MAFLQLIKLQKSFNPEQVTILKEKKLNGNFTIVNILRLLNKVSLFDKYRDRASVIVVIMAVVSGLLGIILSIVLENPIPLFLGVLSVVLLIIYWNKLKKKDLEDHVRNFTVPFLAVLKEDIHSKTKISLNINADKPIHQSYKYHEIPKEGFYGRKISFFKYPWFGFKGELVDKSILSFEINDMIRKIDITKRGMSGKTKYKTKYKKAVFIKTMLVLPKSNYQLVKSDLPENIISENEESIVIKSKLKFKGYSKDDIFPLNKLLNTIQKMYSVVKPV